jgi:hypothetical protein
VVTCSSPSGAARTNPVEFRPKHCTPGWHLSTRAQTAHPIMRVWSTRETTQDRLSVWYGCRGACGGLRRRVAGATATLGMAISVLMNGRAGFVPAPANVAGANYRGRRIHRGKAQWRPRPQPQRFGIETQTLTPRNCGGGSNASQGCGTGVFLDANCFLPGHDFTFVPGRTDPPGHRACGTRPPRRSRREMPAPARRAS